MTFKSSYHLQPCGHPSWAMELQQLGVTIANEIQIFLPPAAMPVTQSGTKGVPVGGHDYK